MLTNEQILAILEKSAITRDAGGQLTIEQAKKFIDLVKSQNEFLQMIDYIDMTADKYQLHLIEVGRRLLRRGIENTDPTKTFGVNITPRELEVVETILPFDVTYDFLENNIEKQNAADLIESMFAKQFGNDSLDLAINGDSSLAATITDVNADGKDDVTGLTQDDHDFLRVNDGWLKLMRADSNVNRYTIPGTIESVRTVLNGILKKLPEKYRTNPAELLFLVSSDIYEDYADEIGVRPTALGDSAITQAVRLPFKGISLYKLPYLPGGSKPSIALTTPKNLAMGVQRKIMVEKERKPRGRRFEYTVTTKTDANYKVGELIVLGEKA